MKRTIGLFLVSVVVFGAGTLSGQEKAVPLDECDYASAEAAGAQWKPVGKNDPAVTVAEAGGRSVLKLPCNFSTNGDWHIVWQRDGVWDLSNCRRIVMDVADDGGRGVFMMIYLRSGEAWYRYTWLYAPPGTNTLTLLREHFTGYHGKPAGWEKITAIRIGVVREEKPVDRAILVSNIRAEFGIAKEPLAEALGRMGKVAGFGGVRELTAAIKANVRGQDRERSKVVLDMLAEAENITRQAGLAIGRGDADEAVKMLNRGQQGYLRAYAAGVPSQPGEFRAVWCHSPAGIRGMTWDQALKTLSDVGFNAIIVNMSWGCAAAHKSKLLPPVGGQKGRDLLAECVAAGKKHGIAVHAWKCNMRCRGRGGSGSEFYKKIKRAGRLQQDSAGKPVDYALCPSDPANLKLEVDSMVEMARDYDVAGIHFDYIRYPGIDACYCPRCRKRFEAEYKVKVKNWPADARSGELKQKYFQFRRDRMTDIVEAVSRRTRKARPNVLISAAVYWHWPSARIRVGQDWGMWVKKGYLDFVCPMQYTSSDADFEGWTQATSRWVGGRIPLMPGIGLVRLLRPDQTLHQILITRKYKTAGFVIFDYRPPPDKEHLPILHLGATAEKTKWKPPKPETDK